MRKEIRRTGKKKAIAAISLAMLLGITGCAGKEVMPEETKVEHWMIQDGGAGIDMQDAAVSDLKEGMGVELEGYFDGETFVATKVIIEDYV